MRRISLFVFSVLFTLLLVSGVQAKTITIDFDGNFTTIGDPLFNQYENEGIYFDTGEGYSPAVIASPSISSSKVLQPNSSSDAFYIYLDYALLSFSCLKWEPSGSSDTATVYWAFMADDDPSVTISNSDKDAWGNVSASFSADNQINKIKIWGENIPEGMSYYLDELIFNLDVPGTSVPEPLTLLLLGLGLMGLAAARKRLKA